MEPRSLIDNVDDDCFSSISMDATFWGVQRAFLEDTTFREGGAFFSIYKKLFGVMHKAFFWDSMVFSGVQTAFFGIHKAFCGNRKKHVDKNPNKTAQKMQKYKKKKMKK